MQDIEPFYNWREIYSAEEDELSPFYQREHSEFVYTNTIYNFYIHPQWDEFGSSTLYMKVLFADYEQNFAVIEFIGEWNDCLNNDIMFLKREIIEPMIRSGISKFILIGENVLNFHASDDCYYEEWFQDVDDGWITALNFREHVLKEFEKNNIDYFLATGGELDTMSWRNFNPYQLLERVERIISHRLTA